MGSDDSEGVEGEGGTWRPAEEFEFPDNASDSNDDDDKEDMDGADLQEQEDDQGTCCVSFIHFGLCVCVCVCVCVCARARVPLSHLHQHHCVSIWYLPLICTQVHTR